MMAGDLPKEGLSAESAIQVERDRWDAARRTGPRRRGASRWVALLTQPIPGDLPCRPATRVQRATLLSLIIAIFVFTTSSHQLTPFFMIAACAGLVLVRRCRLPGLPVLLGVIFAAWLSFAAVAYWSGHLSNIFGGFGDLFSNVSSQRLRPAGGQHAGTRARALLPRRVRRDRHSPGRGRPAAAQAPGHR